MSAVKVIGLTSEYLACNPLVWYQCARAAVPQQVFISAACVCSGPQTISYLAFLLVALNGDTCRHINATLLGRRRERASGHKQSARDVAFSFADVFLPLCLLVRWSFAWQGGRLGRDECLMLFQSVVKETHCRAGALENV